MPQNFVLLLSSWGVLALVVLVLAAYRSQLGRQEDDQIHMLDSESGATITHQTEVARRIDSVEKWGKTLTVVLVVYGIVLGGYYMYTLWQAQNSTVIMQ